MFIITRPRLNFGGVTLTVPELYPFTNGKIAAFLFPFSNFNLLQPNVMKLIHNTYNYKVQIKLEFWWRQIAEFFVSGL